MKEMKLIKQMAIIFAVCLAGVILSKLIPLPATILAMALMLILLGTKIVKVENIEEASGLILGNMAMFFIPSNVSILENIGYMTGNILKLIVICIVTTAITFAVGAYTVTAVTALQKRLAKKDGDSK